ncbi:MAG: hypothetical protein HGA90_04325 [Alphaproteobacteria bacterium]|nr:hypothetical protein [Alphaproteobacteria bacterium]
MMTHENDPLRQALRRYDPAPFIVPERFARLESRLMEQIMEMPQDGVVPELLPAYGCGAFMTWRGVALGFMLLLLGLFVGQGFAGALVRTESAGGAGVTVLALATPWQPWIAASGGSQP